MGLPMRGADLARKATATDVALAAGVSKWTVNRAFKKDAPIAEESRLRVLAAADRLGYRPNLLARSLTTKSTQQVAVLVDDFANPHKLPVLHLLTAALQRERLVAVLVNIDEQNGPVDAILDADQRQVDAVVLLGTSFRDETLRQPALNAARAPLYVLARESTLDAVKAVSCDAAASMEAVGLHLVARGYRRPGFMSGPRTLSTVLGRSRHFAAFWADRGIEAMLDIAVGTYDRRAAGEAMGRYLAATPASDRVDVLVCENDALAIGAMDAARFGCGLDVPGDLAFVGYDGTDLAAAPAYDLTTYEQPMAAMVDRLVDMIVGRLDPTTVSLEGRLVVRGST